MRIAVVIVLGALTAGAVALWKLRDPHLKACTVSRSVSANAPGGGYVAHVETRTCDAGLRGGSFVWVEKSAEPGTLYEAFYTSRNLSEVAVRWRGDRQLEISFSEPLDAIERRYDAQTIANVVAVTLREPGERRDTGS